MTTTNEQIRPVKFPRLATQGIVAGFDMWNLGAMVLAALIVLVGVLRVGPLSIFFTAPIWVPIAGIGVVRLRGQALPLLLWKEIIFMARKLLGATRVTTRPEKALDKPREAGRVSLPGVSGSFRLWETPSGAAVIYHPSDKTLSITCDVTVSGFTQAGPSEQNALVRDWSKVLGSWTLRPGIERIAMLEGVSPGNVEGARAYLTDNQTAFAGSELAASYKESLALADPQVTNHVSRITLTIGLGAVAADVKAYGGGMTGALAVAQMEIEATTAALYSAGFTSVSWPGMRAWAASGRLVVDPDFTELARERHGTEFEGVDPLAAGPLTLEEHRDYVITDSGFHRTFWIHEWPRVETYPGFVDNVVFARQAGGTPVRHTFQIVTAPVTVRKALKRIETDKRTWQVNDRLRSKQGKPTSAADLADWQSLLDQEAAIVAGHGEFAFAGYLTVSATSLLELKAAASAMRNALARSGIEPQVLYTQQAEALMTTAFPTGQGIR